eukprot:jgi/Mesvir1/1297/Mv03762-RA.2
MGAALCVLRVYAAIVYEEVQDMGMGLQSKHLAMAQANMAVFVNQMVSGTVALSCNLHEQELVAGLPADPHNAKARRLAWETLKLFPFSEHVFFATDFGLTMYERSALGAAPLLIRAQPVDPSSPQGNWSGTIVPVDPELGEPLELEGVPVHSFTIASIQPSYLSGLKTPPGNVSWRLGGELLQRGDAVMVYFASSVLGLISDPRRVSNGTLVGHSGDLSPGTVPGLTPLGMAGISQSIASLSTFLGTLDFKDERIFFCQAKDGAMVVANRGNVTGHVGGAAFPSTVTAEMSDDPIIRAAARHLRAAFSVLLASANETLGDYGGLDENTVMAARSGLCWGQYSKLLYIAGRPWYLRCEGKLYGGQEGRLAMVEVLLVPKDSVMGPIDDKKDDSVYIVLAVALCICIVGVAGVFIATVYVDHMAVAKRALEGQAEKQQGEIQVMARELDAARAMFPGGLMHALDMRTPMEMLHDILGDLAAQGAIPGPEALLRIQALLDMPEPHMPVLLQQPAVLSKEGSHRDIGSPRQFSSLDELGKALDAEMATWLRSTVMRMPSPTEATPSLGMPAAGSSDDSACGSPDRPATRFFRALAVDAITELRGHAGGNMHVEDVEGDIGAHGSGGSFGGMSAVSRMGELAALDAAVAMGATYSPTGAHVGVAWTYPTGAETGGEQNGVPGDQGAACVGKDMRPAVMHAQMMSQGMCAALERVGEWNFDAWELTNASGGWPILWMGLEVCRRAGLSRTFQLPLHKLARFLVRLDEGMPDNRYHNGTHIADVTNSLYHLIKSSGVAAYLSQLDILAAVTAALVHDFRHPGLNNDFVVKSSDELALRYNDRTVLENFHVAEAFFLMAEPHLNFLDALSADDYKYVRHVVIELVLASDLKRHFALLESFKKRSKDKDSPLSKSSESDRLLLMQIALKVADIGHSAKKLDIHKKWTAAITEEFYLQGDKEKAAGFQVSAFMDRDNNNLAKSQLGFFSFIACPLFEAWVAAFPNSRFIFDEVVANTKYWEQLQRDQHPVV